MDNMSWELVCPECKSALRYQSNVYICCGCNLEFPVDEDVIRFIATDNFYEGRYPPNILKFDPSERQLWGRLALYFTGMHYFWLIRKYVSPGTKVLDLASGSGMCFLAKRYRMAGLDVSLSSVRKMSEVYSLSLQCDAMKTPLPDGIFDAVVSRFFFEHVPAGEKPELLQECWRLLKPGGWLIVLQDCENDNPLWRWAKRDPALFDLNFIQRDGHYGLLYPSQNLSLFEQAGFRVVQKYGANKTCLVTPSMFGWMQDYRQKGLISNLLLGLAGLTNRYRLLNLFYSILMTAWDDLVEQFLPLDHARYLLTACQKPLGLGLESGNQSFIDLTAKII
jgi:SAM-dependent methyltransferase